MKYIFLILSFSICAYSHSCEYSLPYKQGDTRRTLQGFNGEFTHTPPLQYGVDFKMPEGTEIFAARNGIVLDIKFDSTDSGKNISFLKKSNFIKILHSDRNISFYAHLKYKGVLVSKGQHVKEGQLIGYSGCTGFCDGAHLHFEVYMPAKNRHKRKSLRVNFITSKGIVQNIDSQRLYTSVHNPNKCP